MLNKNIFLLLFFTQILIFAQAPEPTNQLENTEIIIEKNKKIVFPEINKQSEKANISKKQINTLEPPKYEYKEHPTLLPSVEPKIKVPAIKDEQKAQKHPFFLRLGGGNYATTFGEGYVVSNQNKPLQASMHAKHLASGTGPVDFSGASLNKIKGNARYLFKKSILALDAEYMRRGSRFYGYGINKPSENQKDTIYQAYNQFNTNLSFGKNDTTSKFQYQFETGANILQDIKFRNNENQIYLGAKTAYQIDDFSEVKINANYTNITFSNSSSYNRSLFNFRPIYERIINDKITVSGGFNITYSADTSKEVKNVRFFPVAGVEYALTDKLTSYATIEGGILKNTFDDFSMQNPHLDRNINLSHTNEKFNGKIGLRGTPIRYFYTNVSVGYQNQTNLGLFVPTTTDSARFNLKYTSGTIFNNTIEIKFQKSEVFSIGIKSNYNLYNLAGNEKAWHRPSIEALLYFNYQLFNKLSFQFEGFYLGGIIAKNFVSNREVELSPIVDLNLKTNYKLNDRLAIFLYVYNITANNYERFMNYPVKRINIVGGLTLSF